MLRRSLLALAIVLCTVGAKSRYLADHERDLVRWQPWSDAVLAKALTAEKPVFLSIGFASCHWCHVLAAESFRDKATADFINANYVAILVDRDEHPEIDAAYRTFVEAMTGTAGWPANLVLTPDLQPLAATGYAKPADLRAFLENAARRWRDDRPALIASANAVLATARSRASAPAAPSATADALDAAFGAYKSSYDPEHGGFGTAPKFPRPMTVSFLLRYARRGGSNAAREMALHTLQSMARGAIRDQLGGGFHRYTEDAAWRAPHFEKMLTDQALLGAAYLDAYQLTGDKMYAEVARSTLDYVIEDLRLDGAGPFHASQDAASLVPIDGRPVLVEGAFFVWDAEEVNRLLGAEAELVRVYYGVGAEKRALAVVQSDAAIRQRFRFANDQQLTDALVSARQKLFLVREGRPEPARDDTVVAGWNGLAISALARGAAILDEPKYAQAAESAAKFVRANLWDAKAKKLRRRWRGGSAAVDALAEDYAFLVQGLLDLYGATFDLRWLEQAIELQQRQDQLFWKDDRYATGLTIPAAIAGVSAERDASTPAANSVSAMNLLRLGELTNSAPWRTRASTLLRTFSGRLAEMPQLASAAEASLATPRQIVIAGDPRRDATRALLRVARETFHPLRTIVVAAGGTSQQRLAQYMPFVKEMAPIDNAPAAYVCDRYVCRTPVTEPTELAKLLGASQR